MNYDISHLLESWDYQPGQVVVRRFVGKDGQEKLQLRVDLGILQMNAQGRPDGKRPHGRASLFEHYLSRLEKLKARHAGSDEDFVLGGEDCAKLQLEAIQYHHRCICLLQLDDFLAAVRDADRNLQVFDFVAEYAESEEMSWSLQQFRPQVLMIRGRARASLDLQENDYPAATRQIQAALEELREFYHEFSRLDLMEQSQEIQSLEAWLEEVNRRRPLSRREKLEIDLREAVQREDYEKAARVRDALRGLGPSD
jgi:hypothetical protein